MPENDGARPEKPPNPFVIVRPRTLCGGCSYCCWALGDFQVPVYAGHLGINKPRGVACWQLIERDYTKFDHRDHACLIHGAANYPSACRDYYCLYLMLADQETIEYVRWPNGSRFPHHVHRPDVFQDLLRQLRPSGGVIPAVPAFVPLADAEALIRETNTILAAHPDPILDHQGLNSGYIVKVTGLGPERDAGAVGKWRGLVEASWSSFIIRRCYRVTAVKSS